MKKFKLLLLLVFVAFVGVVFASGWIFCTGNTNISTGITGTINKEWTFNTAKALLQGNVVHWVYDETEYHIGDIYNGETITGIEYGFTKENNHQKKAKNELGSKNQ